MQIRFPLLLCTLFSLATPVLGSEPILFNARIERIRPAGSLEDWIDREVGRLEDRSWVAYGVPMLERGQDVTGCCCGWQGVCRLEKDDAAISSARGQEDQPAQLDPDRELAIFLRVSQGRIDRVRFFDEACRIDAAGRSVFWLGSRDADESLALLDRLVPTSSTPAGERPRLENSAVAAMAFHRSERAFQRLAGYLNAGGYPEGVRKQATFWLGQLHQPESLDVLRRVVTNDPSQKVRKQAIFAISLGTGERSTRILVELAREGESVPIRKTALFWLGQRAGRAATRTLTDAAESDPAIEVRKQAVFGISQLPAEEGVPLLIRIARTNRTPAVRKAAMFWLGQSGRPEAVDFFEEILRNP